MEVHFTILLALVLLNIIPMKVEVRKKIILPFSFIILFVYWAFRYEYGQDYWAYYDYFYNNKQTEKGFGELLFYNVFFPMFKYYYQTIIAQSFYVLFTLYYIVRKYIQPKYFWVFFILFMCVPGFHFSLLSAMRSSMAAATMFWAYILFYIRGKNILLYSLMVLVATLFHTSAIVFLIIPLVDRILVKLNGNTIFVLLTVCLLLAMSIGKYLFLAVTSSGDDSFLGSYSHLSDGFGNSNLFGTIHKGIILIPAYFICDFYNKITDAQLKRIFVLAFLCLAIRLLNMDFNGRFTAYLFFFFVVAFCYSIMNLPKVKRMVMAAPYFLIVFFDLYLFYSSIIIHASDYIEGNFYIYKTIFEAPSLP